MSKVTVVGAGAVGATCANVMATREVADEIVLIDIKVVSPRVRCSICIRPPR